MAQQLIVSGTEVPHIKEMKISPEPLWSDDAGREALDGHYSGTYIGYFTKIEITFEYMTVADFNTIKNLLEHPLLEDVQYTLESDQEDDTQGTLYTEDFYNGVAIEANLLPRGDYYNEFTVTLVAVDRRTKLS